MVVVVYHNSYHREKSFQDELLEKHGIDCEDEYLWDEDITPSGFNSIYINCLSLKLQANSAEGGPLRGLGTQNYCISHYSVS